MTIKALIFDFDGLILDTESPMRAAWLETFADHGLAVSEEQWASLLGASADPPEAYELLEKHLGSAIDRTAIHDRVMARELELLVMASRRSMRASYVCSEGLYRRTELMVEKARALKDRGKFGRDLGTDVWVDAPDGIGLGRAVALKFDHRYEFLGRVRRESQDCPA